MHFLELLFVSWEVGAGDSGKCLCPCGRGKSQPFHLFIYLFYSQMEVCVTRRYMQQFHYHTILLISSVSVWPCGEIVYKKRKRKKPLAVLLGGLEGALLCAKEGELLFLRCVYEGLWRER